MSRLRDYFHVHLAIIEVRPGETREDAWKRHVAEHPEARYAKIKIFNRINYDQVGLSSETGQFFPGGQCHPSLLPKNAGHGLADGPP